MCILAPGAVTVHHAPPLCTFAVVTFAVETTYTVGHCSTSRPVTALAIHLLLTGSRRGIGVNEERDQTLNQLLTELDGFEGREGVLLLAATNRAEVRFD